MTQHLCTTCAAVFTLALGTGCQSKQRVPEQDSTQAAPQTPAPPKKRRKPQIVDAPPGDVAQVVGTAREAAALEDMTLVVYVGATWCEPCIAFHDMVKAGQLDEQLTNVRFMEFDHDRDTARLSKAGYASMLLPLFALPNGDGTASGQQTSGTVKGPRSVDVIVERIGALLSTSAG